MFVSLTPFPYPGSAPDVPELRVSPESPSEAAALSDLRKFALCAFRDGGDSIVISPMLSHDGATASKIIDSLTHENLKKWCALQEEEIEELRKLLKNK